MMRPLLASLLVSCLATSTQRRRGSAPASPGRGVTAAGDGRNAWQLREGADDAVGEQATATGLRGRARSGVGPTITGATAAGVGAAAATCGRAQWRGGLCQVEAECSGMHMHVRMH